MKRDRNTMTQAVYNNYQHYLQEGWSKEPKSSFKQLKNLLKAAQLPANSLCLDVGCASGELVHYLTNCFPSFSFVGVDVFEELIVTAKELQPKHEFLHESVLTLPMTMNEKYDLVTVIGVMSIFDETELSLFWDRLFAVTKPGGRIIVLSPLNEYGVDAIIKHRKGDHDHVGQWEAGWNIYSTETINSILSAYPCSTELKRFQIDIDLAPKQDPIRTWTFKTENNARQLTNGLKLLVDHYFISVCKLV